MFSADRRDDLVPAAPIFKPRNACSALGILGPACGSSLVAMPLCPVCALELTPVRELPRPIENAPRRTEIQSDLGGLSLHCLTKQSPLVSAPPRIVNFIGPQRCDPVYDEQNFIIG